MQHFAQKRKVFRPQNLFIAHPRFPMFLRWFFFFGPSRGLCTNVVSSATDVLAWYRKTYPRDTVHEALVTKRRASGEQLKA